MTRRIVVSTAALVLMVLLAATTWIAFPTESSLELPGSLSPDDRVRGRSSIFAADLNELSSGFKSQVFRSFCGPASIATVLRAYGMASADQKELFPSLTAKLRVFFSGMTLAELAALAEGSGLSAAVVYADTLSVDDFRDLLKDNLSRKGDFIVLNYDRRVLRQAGSGHISPVGAYDTETDAFLVLDQAAYKYPFTWIPTQLLYDATRTHDGEQFRGVLVLNGYE